MMYTKSTKCMDKACLCGHARRVHFGKQYQCLFEDGDGRFRCRCVLFQRDPIQAINQAFDDFSSDLKDAAYAIMATMIVMGLTSEMLHADDQSSVPVFFAQLTAFAIFAIFALWRADLIWLRGRARAKRRTKETQK